MDYYGLLWITIWVFPKIMVPPSHPFLIGFSIINHPYILPSFRQQTHAWASVMMYLSLFILFYPEGFLQLTLNRPLARSFRDRPLRFCEHPFKSTGFRSIDILKLGLSHRGQACDSLLDHVVFGQLHLEVLKPWVTGIQQSSTVSFHVGVCGSAKTHQSHTHFIKFDASHAGWK